MHPGLCCGRPTRGGAFPWSPFTFDYNGQVLRVYERLPKMVYESRLYVL